MDYIEMMEYKKLNNTPFIELDSARINQLEEIAINGQKRINAYARNILIWNNELEYQEPIILPEDYFKSKPAPLDGNICDDEKLFEIFPNPANKFFIVKYDLSYYSGKAVVMITDDQGRKIIMDELSSQKDQVVFSVIGFAPGLYFVKFIVNETIKQTEKLIVR